MLIGLLLAPILLFSVATVRTLTLEVNAGLQLAQWENTVNIIWDIKKHQREELISRFKGNTA